MSHALVYGFRDKKICEKLFKSDNLELKIDKALYWHLQYSNLLYIYTHNN